MNRRAQLAEETAIRALEQKGATPRIPEDDGTTEGSITEDASIKVKDNVRWKIYAGGIGLFDPHA